MSFDAVVAEARSWIGTPWHHLGRQKGIGVDCAGLVMETARALGFSMPDSLADYSPIPDGRLLSHCDANLVKLGRLYMRPGDIVVFRFTAEPQHLAIVTDYPGSVGMVHAYAAQRKVVEHRIDDSWMNKIVATYRFKELA